MPERDQKLENSAKRPKPKVKRTEQACQMTSLIWDRFSEKGLKQEREFGTNPARIQRIIRPLEMNRAKPCSKRLIVI
ncbi:hypothetical protein DC20_14865 [Rufibacter tibetensis]|uniref:Uncharacterized protein n=1 Tax=Rufibacter tibetensis TaxID=512763 RepID=A0A0P0CZQ1_9BACT|nr:hypothetical protein DC20_14865 [Rufibacter tibetensis]